MKYLVNRETKEHFVYHGIVPSENWDIVEADAEGWIEWNHSEKFIPLSDDVLCQVHSIHGVISSIGAASNFYWAHVKAYRPILDKPEVVKAIPAPEYDPRSVSFNVLKRLEAAHEAAQRIPEMEAELREVLGAMGYDLVARSPFVEMDSEPLGAEFESALMNNLNKLYDDTPEPDMNDWRNWKPGDLVECITDSYGGSYKKGHIYEISNIFPNAINEIRTVEDEKGSKANGWAACYFRFHSRPEVKS